MRTTVLALFLFTLLVPAVFAADADLIEDVGRTYADAQPGLESYRVKLKTNKIAEMIARMTAAMPTDMPRPGEPQLIKHWRRGMGSVVRTEGAVMPNMQQMINRFSERFAIDLDSFFFAPQQSNTRRQLLDRAAFKSSDTRIAGDSLRNIELTFSEPVALAGAFYARGLDLPQTGVTRLEFEIDAGRKILRQVVIDTETGPRLTVAIRHTELDGAQHPVEIRITSPDGSIDEHFVASMERIAGFQLPTKQTRSIRRPGVVEEMRVDFFDYVVTGTPSQP